MTTQISVEDGEGRFAAHEHRGLSVGLAYIGETIERSRDFTSAELWARLHRTMGWLEHELKPHLTWETTWLYPELDAIAGTPWATKLPRFEHRQIEAAIAGLDADSVRWLGHSTPQTDAHVVAHLSAIQALIAAHIAREDRFLLPLLEDRGTPVG
jgi:iron-sulfur cluster repair protein YtfE (RIC family)